MADAMRIPLFLNRTTTGESRTIQPPGPGGTLQAVVTGTGAVSATVIVRVKNVEADVWETLETLSLSGTTTATESMAFDAHWCDLSVNVSAISAGASVDVVVGSRD